MADRTGTVKRYASTLLGLVLSVQLAPIPRSAAARTLEDALVDTFARPVPHNLGPVVGGKAGPPGREPQKLGQVFAASVAGSFPVTGTSAPYVYRFDSTTDSFERVDTPLGPIFSERAQTVGAHRLSVALNYLFVDYNSINGHSLDSLVSHDPRTPGPYLGSCPPGFCEPVFGQARLDLEAQIIALSATYGLTPDLDVNVFLPVVYTALRADTTFVAPDPRAPPDPRFPQFSIGGTARQSATGVGDLLLRLKYVFSRNAPVDLAGGVSVSMPTGERANFQGTGDTLIGTSVFASRTYVDRIEPHLNLSFVLDADKFDRSQVRYSAGADVRILDWLTLNNDFLGRSDVTQPDSVDQPVFLQIKRSDVFQYSTGIKVAPLRHVVLFFNALLPLNDDGVRADQVLAAGIEGVF